MEKVNAIGRRKAAVQPKSNRYQQTEIIEADGKSECNWPPQSSRSSCLSH